MTEFQTTDPIKADIWLKANPGEGLYVAGGYTDGLLKWENDAFWWVSKYFDYKSAWAGKSEWYKVPHPINWHSFSTTLDGLNHIFSKFDTPYRYHLPAFLAFTDERYGEAILGSLCITGRVIMDI